MTSRPPSGESPPASTPTTARPPLTWRQLIQFTLGGILANWGNAGIKNLSNSVFNLIFGISPVLVGTLMALTRLWDALIDPVFGAWSDSASTRWGRRRPFIAAGALGCGLLTFLLFSPPAWLVGGALNLWVIGLTLLFFVAFTSFAVPYLAFAIELHPEDEQRNRLFSMNTVFNAIGNMAFSWIFPLAMVGWLGTPRESMVWIAVGLGTLLAAAGLCPFFFFRESSAQRAKQIVKIPLWTALKSTFRQAPFRRILVVMVTANLGTSLVNSLGVYVVVYHVFGGDMKAASVLTGWTGMIYSLTMLAAVPPIKWLIGRIGKRNALMTSLAIALVGSGLKWPLNDPAHPWTVLLVPVFLAPGLTGIWLIFNTMIADVCDLEEFENDRRIQGSFTAVFGWFQKASLSLSIFVSGFIIQGAGFDVDKGADQAPGTILALRLAYAFVPFAALLVALLALRGYRLDSARMAQIRTALKTSQ